MEKVRKSCTKVESNQKLLVTLKYLEVLLVKTIKDGFYESLVVYLTCSHRPNATAEASVLLFKVNRQQQVSVHWNKLCLSFCPPQAITSV